MGEFELIERLKKILPEPSKNILVGIGDDTLVAKTPAGRLLSTIDCLVENVHFDFNYCLPQEVGWKSLAVNLSDIAAMGGKPHYALVSLVIPKRITEKQVLKVYEGIRDCALWAKVDVVGGNISRGLKDFVIDISVVGEASKPLLRSGAQENQGVALTGFPGLAAAGYLALKKWGRKALQKYPISTEQHLKPMPRLDWAQQLGTLGVTSLIDISDGVSSELNHLFEQSKVGFEIEERLLPMAEELKLLCQELKKDPLDLMLHGGEQYELLMTFPLSKFGAISASAYQNNIPFTLIGHTVSNRQKVKLRNRKDKLKPILPKGWTHF